MRRTPSPVTDYVPAGHPARGRGSRGSHGASSAASLLSYDDVAHLLGVSVRQVERYRASGELRAVELGGRVRFTEGLVAAFIEGRISGSGNCSQPEPVPEKGAAIVYEVRLRGSRDKRKERV